MVEQFRSNPNIFVSKVILPDEIKENDSTRILFSRSFPSDIKNGSGDGSYQLVYIGRRETTLTSLMFYFNRSKFWKLDGDSELEEILFVRTNRELMKRYYLIEKARDSKIFGILVGTMSVARYREAIRHVETLLKKASRRYYSFLIGKLNCPKLNNFMEVRLLFLIFVYSDYLESFFCC